MDKVFAHQIIISINLKYKYTIYTTFHILGDNGSTKTLDPTHMLWFAPSIDMSP